MTLDRTDSLEQMLGHADWITRLSRALGGSGAEAEDVAQDTWVDVLRAPLGSIADPRRWLRAIMRRRAAKLRRSEERRRRREQEVAQQHEPVPSADDLTARVTMQRELTDAVLALDEPYRSTIVLRFFEQLDVDAIATRTGSPRNTVRSRLQRGLQLLRARLDQGGGRQRWLPGVIVLGGRRLASEAAAVSIATTGLALLSMKKLTPSPRRWSWRFRSIALTWFDDPSPPRARGLPDTAKTADAVTSGIEHRGSGRDRGRRQVERARQRDIETGSAPEVAAEPTGELIVRVEADGGAASGIHVYLARSVAGASRAARGARQQRRGRGPRAVAAGKVLV
jgi:RNA polymerase sigma-70 factor (ECF subfamily)